MNKTNEEFLEKIDNFYNLINSCDISLLHDEDFLTNIISTIGLYNEKDRRLCCVWHAGGSCSTSILYCDKEGAVWCT
jgi:hypothetical protein